MRKWHISLVHFNVYILGFIFLFWICFVAFVFLECFACRHHSYHSTLYLCIGIQNARTIKMEILLIGLCAVHQQCVWFILRAPVKPIYIHIIIAHCAMPRYISEYRTIASHSPSLPLQHEFVSTFQLIILHYDRFSSSHFIYFFPGPC